MFRESLFFREFSSDRSPILCTKIEISDLEIVHRIGDLSVGRLVEFFPRQRKFVKKTAHPSFLRRKKEVKGEMRSNYKKIPTLCIIF